MSSEASRGPADPKRDDEDEEEDVMARVNRLRAKRKLQASATTTTLADPEWGGVATFVARTNKPVSADAVESDAPAPADAKEGEILVLRETSLLDGEADASSSLLVSERGGGDDAARRRPPTRTLREEIDEQQRASQQEEGAKRGSFEAETAYSRIRLGEETSVPAKTTTLKAKLYLEDENDDVEEEEESSKKRSKKSVKSLPLPSKRRKMMVQTSASEQASGSDLARPEDEEDEEERELQRALRAARAASERPKDEGLLLAQLEQHQRKGSSLGREASSENVTLDLSEPTVALRARPPPVAASGVLVESAAAPPLAAPPAIPSTLSSLNPPAKREDSGGFVYRPSSSGVSAFLRMLRASGELYQDELVVGRANDPRVDPNLNRPEDAVRLEYRDEEGRLLTTKEAYRQAAYQFHGSQPGPKKREKRLKELEREKARRLASAERNVELIAKVTQETLKQTGEAHILLNNR